MSSRRHFTQPPARAPTFLHAAQYLKAHMAGTRSDHVVESTPVVRELEASRCGSRPLFSRHHLVSRLDIGREAILARPAGVFGHLDLFLDLVERLALFYCFLDAL